MDSTGKWMYVVNSNSDLRYNSGTVVALDVTAAAADRLNPAWGVCPALAYVPPVGAVGHNCCRDPLNQQIVICDERPYVAAGQTVAIGSFGGSVVQQEFSRGSDDVHRLFLTVRGEPSITFIDSVVRNGEVQLNCAADVRKPGVAQSCSEDFRVRSADNEDDPLRRLPEEPYALNLDAGSGILYVGHLLGGLATIDVCAPGSGRQPLLGSVAYVVFPQDPGQAVTSITLTNPGTLQTHIHPTARFSGTVGDLTLRSPQAGLCDPTAPPAGVRDLALVAAPGFESSAFYPVGTDVRSVIYTADQQQAYLLHRNSGRTNPSAIVLMDLSQGTDGRPKNRAITTVEVCSSPTEMKMHDAGRGPRLFVTCFETGQIYVVDPLSLSVTAIVDAGRGPTNLVFSPADPGTGYLASFADNDLTVLDLHPGSPSEYRIIQRIGFPRPNTPK